MYTVVTNNVQISVLRTSKICGFSFMFCFFNWRITALQCGLCRTSTWISHIYICIFSLSSHSPQPTIPPLQVVTGRQPALPVLHSSFPPVHLFYTREYIYVCVSMLLSQFLLASPSPTVSASPTCLYLHFFSVNRFIGAIFLDSIYAL